MNDLEEMYDDVISNDYDTDRFNLLAESRKVSISQIMNQVTGKTPDSIVDFAVGTATTLFELKGLFPESRLAGIDISKNMIAIAKQKLAIDTYHDDVRNIDKYIPDASIDLALIHFLLAYVEPEITLGKARKLLKPGGLCSIASTTYQCFPHLQEMAGHFVSQGEIALTKVPQDPESLVKILEAIGFEIVARESLSIDVIFSDFHDLYNWGMSSGWLTPNFSILDSETIDAIKSREDLIQFPFRDQMQATIVLATKN